MSANTRTDDRVYAMYLMKCIPLDKLIQIIYPDLYPLHNLMEQVNSYFRIYYAKKYEKFAFLDNKLGTVVIIENSVLSIM